VLLEAHVSSAPVLDNGKPVAFVDVLDLSTFVMSCIKSKILDPHNQHKKKLSWDKKKWAASTARDIANCSHRNPFVTLRDTANLLHVVKALIAVGSGHRVLIVNEKQEIQGLLSQGDVVKVFWTNIDRFEVAKKTVKELKFGFCEVMRALSTTLTYEAFEKLARRNISGLAVVNEDGHTLLGNLSGSDVKQLGENIPETWNRLLLPVAEFLKEHAGQARPVYILQSDTISTVAHKFSEAHVHRLFIADHDERMNLIGVISLSDVLKLLHQSASTKQLATTKHLVPTGLPKDETASKEKKSEKKEKVDSSDSQSTSTAAEKKSDIRKSKK